MSDALMPRPDQDIALVRLKGEAYKLREDALALTVSNKDEAEFATAYLGEIAKIKKEAEAYRVKLVQPHNDYTTAVNGTVKSLLAPVLEADKHLRQIVLTWQLEEERKAKEELDRKREEALAAEKAAREEADRKWHEAEKARQAAVAAARAADYEAQAEADRKAAEALIALQQAEAAENARAREATLAVQGKVETTVRAAGMGAATTRKRWTFRVTDLSHVPAKFLVLNESLVRKAIAAGERRIDGLEIFQEDELAVSRSRV